MAGVIKTRSRPTSVPKHTHPLTKQMAEVAGTTGDLITLRRKERPLVKKRQNRSSRDGKRFIASQDIAEILFGTNFLHSLQASDELRHQALFIQLQDALPASVVSEAQLALPRVFDKSPSFVCDALR